MVKEKDFYQKVLLVDVSSKFYRVDRFKVGDYFGPPDLGLYLAGKYNSLNIGTGLLAGSIFPGSNRLFFSGFSPCWGGFYISSMGGAGLVFDNLGINTLSIVGWARTPSILYLNRIHGEEIKVDIFPIDLHKVWQGDQNGVYAIIDNVYKKYGQYYENDPRILATGPASEATDFGAICSVPIQNGKVSSVDTWAGRGGFGTKMLKQHNIAAVIYGGTYIDEDFRDRKVADQWFEDKYKEKMAAKDIEATTKYRFEENFGTGGTFGVNYTTMDGSLIAFNYRSIYLKEERRIELHQKYILDHYLKQFNQEIIQKKSQKTCGEPCAAVCKKMHGIYKKDYEPYQALGPLCGIFDQRAAEKLVHHADCYGFDAIAIGGVLAWLMDCIDHNLLSPSDLGVSYKPVFEIDHFRVVETDSMHNADLGIAILDGIIRQEENLNLNRGARELAKRLSRNKNEKIIHHFIYNGFARRGWMVPNQYWTPGVLSPMAMTGKYYMYYGSNFLPPRELGRKNAKRFEQELILDMFGMCRFHRKWAEEMIPEIIGSLFGLKELFLKKVHQTACHINTRNASVFWESERNIDFIYSFLKRKQIVEKEKSKELTQWIDYFERDKKEAAMNFWYEIHKGITESLHDMQC
ncbi:MAG: aldehyde ferredoxin oxidoreductase N-terminal domain-containing protein [Atribacterota bacterium]